MSAALRVDDATTVRLLTCGAGRSASRATFSADWLLADQGGTLILAVLAVLAVVAINAVQGANSPCARLAREVAAGNWQGVAAAALDAKPDCVPILARRLADRNDTRYAAAYALALLNDPQAQDALYARLARGRDIRLKALAAMGAGSVRRPKDVSFLCEALHGEPFGDEWPPIEAAALSLSVRGAPECRHALEQAAKGESSISGGAAFVALSTAAAKPRCRGGSPLGDSEGAVRAVMNCAVPRSEEAPAFYEAAQNRVWFYAAGGWATRAPDATEPRLLPTISFTTVFGQRGERGLVSLALTFGPLNGSGYDYLVAREGSEWVVIALQSTWIS
jgi:hypothetical protein